MSLIFTEDSFDALVDRLASAVLERLPKPDPSSPYMTTAEAADHLRCSRQRVHDLLSAQRLTRLKEGGRTLLKRAEVEALVKEAQQ